MENESAQFPVQEKMHPGAMVSNQITIRILWELLFLNIDFQSLKKKKKLRETYFAHLEYSPGTWVFMTLLRVKRDRPNCLNMKGSSKYKGKQLKD